MTKLVKSAEELKALIPQSLGCIYDYSQIKDLKVDIIENGMLSPIPLSKDGIPLDGYRRIAAALEIPGFEDLEVLKTNLEATQANRIAFNNHREKTWEDKRNEYMVAFETFGKKQGQKDPLVEYNRHDEINKKTKGKFKDRKTLIDLEWILNRDIYPYPMSKWIFERNCPVSPIKQLMDLSDIEKEKYAPVIQKVVNFSATPTAAMKEIRTLKDVENGENNTFTIPANLGMEHKIHLGDKEDLLMTLDEEEVSVVFFQCEKYNHSTHDLASFTKKCALQVKPFTEGRMKETGSLMIFAKEVYHNGFAKRFPQLLIDNIEKETGMLYKQTFHINESSSFSSAKPKKVLSDSSTQLLWFVKKKNFGEFNKPEFVVDKSEFGNVKTSTYVYQTCSNFIDNQQYVDLIQSDWKKNPSKNEKDDKTLQAIENASSLLPITLSSKPGDLILDFTMDKSIGSLSTLLNRRYIGSNVNPSLVAKTRQQITSASRAFTDYKLPESPSALSKGLAVPKKSSRRKALAV